MGHWNYRVVKKQIEAFFNGKAIYLIKEFVIGKIKNQKNLMVYFAKYWLKKSKAFKAEVVLKYPATYKVVLKSDAA